MLVGSVYWKKEFGVAQWIGRVELWKEEIAYVGAADNPSRFIAKVFDRNELVHQSEHPCACKAKAAAGRAMQRAHVLRTDGT